MSPAALSSRSLGSELNGGQTAEASALCDTSHHMLSTTMLLATLTAVYSAVSGTQFSAVRQTSY